MKAEFYPFQGAVLRPVRWYIVADTGCCKPLSTYAHIHKFNLMHTMNEMSLTARGTSYPVLPRNTYEILSQ